MLGFLLPCAAVDSEVWRTHAERIKLALHYADISVEKAAIWMGIDRSQLRRQLGGEGHLSARRLASLPIGFHQWYGLLLLEELGIPAPVRRAIKVHLALAARKRMARATLADEKAQAAS